MLVVLPLMNRGLCLSAGTDGCLAEQNPPPLLQPDVTQPFWCNIPPLSSADKILVAVIKAAPDWHQNL